MQLMEIWSFWHEAKTGTLMELLRQHLHYSSIVVVSVLPLGRFLASIFSTLSCFPPFSLVPHMTILSETHSVYPIVSFPLVFFLSSDPLSPPSAAFRL